MSTEIEVWRDIPKYQGIYQASNIGRIRSIDRVIINNGRKMKIKGKIMKTFDNGKGYYKVHLRKDGKTTHEYVHRLVSMAFHPVTDLTKVHVNHLDEKPGNNREDNLEWVTCKENNNYGGHNKRMQKTKRIFGNKFNKKVICDGKVFHSVNACNRFYHLYHGAISNYLTGRYSMPQKFINLGLRYA